MTNTNAGKCNSCGGPSTVDFKRYPGGSFCENKGCPAYQEIPAAEKNMDNKCGCHKVTTPRPSQAAARCKDGDHCECDGPDAACQKRAAEEGEERFDLDGTKINIGFLCEHPEELKIFLIQFLSRTRKEAEAEGYKRGREKWKQERAAEIENRVREAKERTWRKAVGAVPEKESIQLEGLTDVGKAVAATEGWNAARQQLITAAKDSGVNLEV